MNTDLRVIYPSNSGWHQRVGKCTGCSAFVGLPESTKALSARDEIEAFESLTCFAIFLNFL